MQPEFFKSSFEFGSGIRLHGPLARSEPDRSHVSKNASRRSGGRRCIREGADRDYLPHAWVVMPNHVHLLITPHIDVSQLMHKLKGVTARHANKLLSQTGQKFWQDESYDHLARGSKEVRSIGHYILHNPVRAGLAVSPEEYPWSSATKRDGVKERDGLKPVAG